MNEKSCLNYVRHVVPNEAKKRKVRLKKHTALHL